MLQHVDHTETQKIVISIIPHFLQNVMGNLNELMKKAERYLFVNLFLKDFCRENSNFVSFFLSLHLFFCTMMKGGASARF